MSILLHVFGWGGLGLLLFSALMVWRAPRQGSRDIDRDIDFILVPGLIGLGMLAVWLVLMLVAWVVG